MKKKHILISIAAVLIGVGTYFAITLSKPSIPYTYQPPENINDGLDVGTLEETSIDSTLIEKAISEINRGKYKEVHSMLIFKDAMLVVEGYFQGHEYIWDAPKHHGELVTWNSSTAHEIMSVTKSITSTCIGIAIDRGFIESVHQSIFDYLPEHQHLNIDGKDQITIEHLLTMTSGLEWDEWSAPLSSADNDAVGIWFYGQEDPIDFVLQRPLVSEPGTRFTYSGGNMFVLGEIIKYATNMTIDEFSGKYLFEPLGIDPFDWSIQYENGEIDTAGSLIMTPRDMVKIGVTFLNEGVWNGERIISEQWVEKSAIPFGDSKAIDVPGTAKKNVGYSYSWWTKQYSESGKEINVFYAGGWGGQNIVVFPELNAVTVTTGGTYASSTRIFTLLEKYIIPAIS